MSDYAKITFEFGREMGARLRALRRLRKLSLREPAPPDSGAGQGLADLRHVGIFHAGLAEVGIGRKTGYVDRQGKCVWEPSE